MTSGQYSFCLLLNADWLIHVSEGLAVCKVNAAPEVWVARSLHVEDWVLVSPTLLHVKEDGGRCEKGIYTLHSSESLIKTGHPVYILFFCENLMFYNREFI